MWRSADGRVNTAALPDDVDELSGFRALLRTLSPEVWKSLDEQLDEFTEALYYELDEIPIDEAVEAEFVGEALPPEFASNLDWGRLLGEDCSAELARIDLRWRMDVAEAVMSMITDLENDPTVVTGVVQGEPLEPKGAHARWAHGPDSSASDRVSLLPGPSVLRIHRQQNAIAGAALLVMVVSGIVGLVGTQGNAVLLYIAVPFFGVSVVAVKWTSLNGSLRVDRRAAMEAEAGYNTISHLRYELPLVDDRTGLVLRTASKTHRADRP